MSRSPASRGRACYFHCRSWRCRPAQPAPPRARKLPTCCGPSAGAISSPRAHCGSAWGGSRPKPTSTTRCRPSPTRSSACVDSRRRERVAEKAMPAPGYSPLVERYFTRPVGAGGWPAGAGQTVAGEAGSEEQGTRVRFELLSVDGVVTEARFQAFGCPHTIAAASWLAEHLKGRPLDRAMPVPILELGGILEVPTEKRGRLLVVEDALHAALAQAQKRQG